MEGNEPFESQTLRFEDGSEASGMWARLPFTAVWTGVDVNPTVCTWGKTLLAEDGSEWRVEDGAQMQDGRFRLYLRDVPEHFSFGTPYSHWAPADMRLVSDAKALRNLQDGFGSEKELTITVAAGENRGHQFEASVRSTSCSCGSGLIYRVSITDELGWTTGELVRCVETPEEAILLMRNLADRGLVLSAFMDAQKACMKEKTDG